jgi:hypothetical protein
MVQSGVKGVQQEAYNFKGIAKDINGFDPDRLTQALTKPGEDAAVGKVRAQQLTTAVNLAAKEGWAPGLFRSVVRTVIPGRLLHVLGGG